MTTAHDLFFLAHYAYNTLNPLIEEAKTIEPSTVLYLDMAFAHEQAAYHTVPKISAYVHWGREGMLAASLSMRNRTDVDMFADTLRAKIDKLRNDETNRALFANADLATV